MERVSNTASPQDLCKALRANLSSVDTVKACKPFEEVAETFQDVICDLLDVTPRVSVSVLEKAVGLVFRTTAEEARLWSQRICGTISYVRLKVKGTVTGVRLAKAVQRIGKRLGKQPDKTSLGSSLLSKARALQRQASSPSKKPEPTARAPTETTARALPEPAPKPKPSTSAETQESQASASTARPSTSASPSLVALPDAEVSVNKRLDFSAASIFAAFGLTEPSEPASCSCLEIISSQELLSDGEANKESAAPKPSGTSTINKEWVDSSSLCMLRVYASGQQVQAQLVAGPGGFAVAQFPGEQEVRRTEVPNTVLLARDKGKVLKRPAKAEPVAKKQKVVEESADEAEEEEEAREEDEAEELSEVLESEPEPSEEEQGEQPKAKGKARSQPKEQKETKAKAAKQLKEPMKATAKDVSKAVGKAKAKASGQPQGKQKAKAKAARQPDEPTMSYIKMWYKAGAGSFGIRRARGDKKQIFCVSRRGANREQLEAVADRCLEMLGTCDEEEVKAWAKDAVKNMEE
jgi:hypothetical protein